MKTMTAVGHQTNAQTQPDTHEQALGLCATA